LLKDILGNRLAGLFWSINDQVSDTANNHVFRKLIWGEEKILESINGLSFEVALDSFFQTNLYSAEKLYQKVLNYAGIKEKGLYLDLYCGTGTVAQILANECLECRVIGVDIEESAVEDARLNAKRNNLSNVEFFCEDVRIFLKNHSELVGKIDALVIDPPRSGLSPKALQRSIDLGSSNIIYVSCNPSTMARDTKILKLNGFKLSKFTMVDQFPHTSHIECLGLFKKE
jgi:23S rRNA (uracil-5-)-methyltransferase RumA